MKQLITRVDEDLHRRLRERAAAEGRSVNAYVTDLLEAALDAVDPRAALRARLASEGRLVLPPVPADAPSRDDAVAAMRGAGTAVSEALRDERTSS